MTITNRRVLIVAVIPANFINEYGWRALMNELVSENGDAAAAAMRVRLYDMHGSHLYTPPKWRADAAAYLAANPIDDAKVRAKARPTHRAKKVQRGSAGDGPADLGLGAPNANSTAQHSSGNRGGYDDAKSERYENPRGLTVGDRAICPRPLLRATQSVPRACIFDLKLASASASA